MADYEFVVDGEVLTCSTERQSDLYIASVGDRRIEVLPAGHGLFRVMVNGQRKIIAAVEKRGVHYLDIDSIQLELREPDQESLMAGDQAAQKDKAFAPMPGKIVKVLVNVGDAVKQRQAVLIVEAMKMENQVLSPSDGTVKAINCQVGDQVDTETVLVELDLKEPRA